MAKLRESARFAEEAVDAETERRLGTSLDLHLAAGEPQRHPPREVLFDRDTFLESFVPREIGNPKAARIAEGTPYAEFPMQERAQGQVDGRALLPIPITAVLADKVGHPIEKARGT
jgi:hypothetical protein